MIDNSGLIGDAVAEPDETGDTPAPHVGNFIVFCIGALMLNCFAAVAGGWLAGDTGQWLAWHTSGIICIFITAARYAREHPQC